MNMRSGQWTVNPQCPLTALWTLGVNCEHAKQTVFSLLVALVVLSACAPTPEPTRPSLRALIPTSVQVAQGLDANAAWLFGTATPSPTPTATGTPGASPTPTLTPTPVNATTLKGKLLFLSSRTLPAIYAPANVGNLKLVSPEMFKLFSQGGGAPVWEYDPTFGKVTPCDPPPPAPTPAPAGATPSALLFGDLSQIVGHGASVCQTLYDDARQAQTFSPDKRFEAYVGSDPNAGRPQIFVLDHSTNTVKMVTRFGSGVSYAPAFAPDGYRIAFVSQAEGPDNIYSVTRDGTDLQPLTRLPGQGWSSWEWIKFLTWSADGKQLAFWSNKETGAREIWLMNADGSNLHTISDDPRPAEDWDPVWLR